MGITNVVSTRLQFWMVIVLRMYWIRATFPQRDLFTVIMAATLMNSYEGQLSTVRSLYNPSEECPRGFYGFYATVRMHVGCFKSVLWSFKGERTYIRIKGNWKDEQFVLRFLEAVVELPVSWKCGLSIWKRPICDSELKLNYAATIPAWTWIHLYLSSSFSVKSEAVVAVQVAAAAAVAVVPVVLISVVSTLMLYWFVSDTDSLERTRQKEKEREQSDWGYLLHRPV